MKVHLVLDVSDAERNAISRTGYDSRKRLATRAEVREWVLFQIANLDTSEYEPPKAKVEANE